MPGPRRDPGREVASRSKTYTLQWFVKLFSGSTAGKRSEVSQLVTTQAMGLRGSLLENQGVEVDD